MASLEIRHSRKCALGAKRTRDLEGCSGPPACRPSYTVLVYRPEGGFDRHPAGKNRREAEHLQNKLSVGVVEGNYSAPKSTTFAAWGKEWIANLERKENTLRDYRRSVAYATDAFGNRKVRDLGPGDVATFNALLKERGISASTRAKHLRVIGACLQSALVHGYAGRNPVRNLPPSEKPRAEHKEAAYFENAELTKIMQQIVDPMHTALFTVAAMTGMRQGEIVALTWGDVDLVDAVIRVSRNYTAGILGSPKNRERRDVDVIPECVKVLTDWKVECGMPADDVLVFPGDGPSGYISTSTLTRRVLYPAMERAGIPRIGPTGEKRTFHSLRHSFAKRSLELGLQATWLQRQLGHSSLMVTTGIYGHWQRSERRREAALLEGAFNFGK